MKNNKLVFGIAILFAIGLSVFFLNNYQFQIQERLDKPIKLFPAVSGACGIEQCHGLDITCGPNVAEMCTTEAGIADFCRQYVRCEKVGSECRLVADTKFEACKSCIGRCNAEADLEKSFQCASTCIE